MSERIEVFAVEGHPRIQISLRAGEVRLGRGSDHQVTVDVEGSAADGFRIEQIGDLVVVEAGKSRGLRFRSADVTVRLPEGADVDIKVGAGDVIATVPLGRVEVSGTAGDVRLTDTGDTQVKTASGDIEIESVSGRLSASSASGDVRIGRVLDTASAKTMSGNVTIADFAGTRCVAGTMAGDVRIGIPGGRRLRVDLQTLSGDVRNELPFREGDTSGEMELSVKTMSGDIVLLPA